MDKKFEAKRDVFIYIALVIVFALVAIVAVFMRKNPLWVYIMVLVIISLIALFFLACVCRTHYVLKEDYLLIVSGILKKKVFYRDIERVEPNYSVWASSALSFDRIKIWTGKGFWQREFIAVKDTQGMIVELKERASEARKILEYRK